jgi:hypothetical protein
MPKSPLKIFGAVLNGMKVGILDPQWRSLGVSHSRALPIRERARLGPIARSRWGG